MSKVWDRHFSKVKTHDELKDLKKKQIRFLIILQELTHLEKQNGKIGVVYLARKFAKIFCHSPQILLQKLTN